VKRYNDQGYSVVSHDYINYRLKFLETVSDTTGDSSDTTTKVNGLPKGRTKARAKEKEEKIKESVAPKSHPCMILSIS
jgi:hypothetical protein